MSLADYNLKLEDDLSDLLSVEFDDSDGYPVVEFRDTPPAKRGRPRKQDLLPEQSSANQWDPRLILDLALGIEDTRDILTRYGLTDNDYIALCGSRTFRQELAVTIRDIHENGLPFRAKARVQAEAYLEVINDLVYDDNTPATTKLEAIRSTVRWANLEPKEEKGPDAGSGQTVNVQINF